jgi:hypothetical protein
VQTLEIALRDWSKGLRTVRCRIIMLVSYYGRSHLVVVYSSCDQLYH